MARVLWIDLCFQPSHPALCDALAHAHDLMQVDAVSELASAIAHFAPRFACVEYDYPDARRLQAITQLRRDFPALPVLMFTEHHSEALALWAFRSGVWDYRVKPVEDAVLRRSLAIAGEWIARYPDHCRVRLPPDLIEPAGHLVRPPTAATRTGAAIAYLLKHYPETIRRDALAAACHLCASEFSRAFRRENGVTVDRYLLALRIAKARDYLTEPGMSVSEVAYAVGFNDPSYF